MMVALCNEETGRGSNRQPIRQLLETQYWDIATQEPLFQMVVVGFHNQLTLHPEQCERFIEGIVNLRDAVWLTRELLIDLKQEHAHQLQVQASITKLNELDEHLTEILLYLAMFAPLCHEILNERVDLHLLLRALLQTANSTLQDTFSQLAALAEMAMFLPEEEGVADA